MKRIVLAVLVAVLVMGFTFSPFSASAVSAAACGDTYTVQKGDYLTKIAKTCGVTYNALVKANPEIKDANKIYPGQVIRIKAGATLPTTTNYTVVKGDTLSKIAVRFGTTVAKILDLNTDIKDSNKIYVGQVIKLPANSGSSSGTVPQTGASVTISSTSAKAGATITVKVKGFPANTPVDFRLGKDGKAYSVVVDGKTNASGEASADVKIPSSANAGEKWVVKVLTTDLVNGKEAKSPLITIAQ